MSVARTPKSALLASLAAVLMLGSLACGQNADTQQPLSQNPASVLLNDAAGEGGELAQSALKASEQDPAPPAELDTQTVQKIDLSTPDAPEGVQVDLSNAVEESPLTPEVQAPGSSLEDDLAVTKDLSPIPDLDRQEQNAAAMVAAKLAAMDARLSRIESLVEAQSAQLMKLSAGVDPTALAELKALRQELSKLSGSKVTSARVSPDADVSEPASQQGTLVIQHNGLAPYQLRINGKSWYVNPGRSELKVPLGTVTTELVGYESAKLWDAADWREVDGALQLVLEIN